MKVCKKSIVTLLIFEVQSQNFFDLIKLDLICYTFFSVSLATLYSNQTTYIIQSRDRQLINKMQNSIESKRHYVHCTFVLRSVTYYYINIVIDVIFINQLLRFLEKVNEKSKTLS